MKIDIFHLIILVLNPHPTPPEIFVQSVFGVCGGFHPEEKKLRIHLGVREVSPEKERP